MLVIITTKTDELIVDKANKLFYVSDFIAIER